MKILVVLSAFIMVIHALSDQESWINFKATHSKSYQHIREEQLRYQIFQNNLKRIEEHNDKYENGEVSYYLAVNQFADMTSEEFMAMFNKRISNSPNLNTTLFEAGDIKVEHPVDWRDDGVVTEVKDQKDCACGWAFSATGALEGQSILIMKQIVSLSEQELLDCSKENDGCNGGDMLLAFEYVKENQISGEGSYRYTGKVGTCRSEFKELRTVTGYISVARNEKALKTAVGTVGPISAEVLVNNDWQLYGGGIFDHSLCVVSATTPLNHAVLAVGYGNDKKDYWIIKNSWGTTWGENGYIRLVRGKNQCGISNRASFPTVHS